MSELPNVVQLDYRREAKTELFSGSLTAGETHYTFSSLAFNAILERAAELLRNYPGHRLLFKREEAPYPMVLPENIEHLLRTDLPAAIAALTISPQRVVIDVPKSINQLGLRHGFDILSDALGERVYVRWRLFAGDQVQIEDPITGRWVVAEKTLLNLLVYKDIVYDQCQPSTDQKWCTVSVGTLLHCNKPRYYLPRGWNPSQGWINHEDLVQMYETYLKERHYASRS